jgi:iron complex outermembrane receptor protein
MRHVLLGSTSLGLAAGIGGAMAPAIAQDVLETVIVSAEKQVSDVQKTAIAITAINPETQAATGNVLLQDMLSLVPSINILTNFGPQPGVSHVYYTRGVGTSTGEATVASLDNVYAPSGTLDQIGYFDVSRVEVLRGPQGTLYGRNAEIGAINIFTNDPSDKYEGKVFVEGGAYNEVSSQAVVNIPISDEFALRVSSAATQRTGFISPTGSGSQDSEAGRVKLSIKPDQDLTIIVSGAFSNAMTTAADDVIPQNLGLANFASPAFGGFNPCGGNPHPQSGNPYKSPPSRYGAFPCTVPAQPPVNPSPVTGVCQRVARNEATLATFAAQANWDLGFGNFFFVASDNIQRAPLGAHASGGFTNEAPNGTWSNPDTQIVEARISNPTGQDWKWIGGLYWENDATTSFLYNHTAVTGTCAPVGCVTATGAPNGVSAVFGQTTVPLSDAFRVIGGLRYSRDWRDSSSWSINYATHAILAPGKSRNAFVWPTVTYKAGAEYDISADNMIYTTAATGFRQGSSSSDQFCIDNTTKLEVAALSAATGGGCPTTATRQATIVAVAPDKTQSYEIGSKNRFFDNKVQINADVFYEYLSDFSQSAFSLTHANQEASFSVDIKGAKGWGEEFDSSWLLTQDDRIDFNISYLHTEIGDADSGFQYPVCFNYGVTAHTQVEDILNTTNRALCGAKNLAANPVSINWVRYRQGLSASDPLPHAPTWSGNFAYSHIFDLSSGANVTAKVLVHFESKTSTNIQPFPAGENPAYHQTEASLTYDTADGKWALSAWVKNIEDNFVVTAVGAPSGSGYAYVFPTMPRTWGVNLSARF